MYLNLAITNSQIDRSTLRSTQGKIANVSRKISKENRWKKVTTKGWIFQVQNFWKLRFCRKLGTVRKRPLPTLSRPSHSNRPRNFPFSRGYGSGHDAKLHGKTRNNEKQRLVIPFVNEWRWVESEQRPKRNQGRMTVLRTLCLFSSRSIVHAWGSSSSSSGGPLSSLESRSSCRSNGSLACVAAIIRLGVF